MGTQSQSWQTTLDVFKMPSSIWQVLFWSAQVAQTPRNYRSISEHWHSMALISWPGLAIFHFEQWLPRLLNHCWMQLEQISETSCTSSRSSCRWQAQLLQVSAELSERLQDPHFVAMRCDLDGSGDLNLHELQLAARVFGIKLDGPQLQQLAEPRISKECFAAMVADFQGSEGKRALGFGSSFQSWGCSHEMSLL